MALEAKPRVTLKKPFHDLQGAIDLTEPQMFLDSRQVGGWEAIASRLEAIAFRLEAIYFRMSSRWGFFGLVPTGILDSCIR